MKEVTGLLACADIAASIMERNRSWPSWLPNTDSAPAFLVRHQPQYVAAGIANSGNVIEGTVGIGLVRHGSVCPAISEHDLGIGLQCGQRDRIGIIITLGVGNGEAHHLPGFIVPGKVDADPSYSVKGSECEPIRTRCNSFPSTRYIRSQSGSMCVSRYPFQIPRNG